MVKLFLFFFFWQVRLEEAFGLSLVLLSPDLGRLAALTHSSAALLLIRKFRQFMSDSATRHCSAAVSEGWTSALFFFVILPPTGSVFKMLSERYVAAIKTSSLCT